MKPVLASRVIAFTAGAVLLAGLSTATTTASPGFTSMRLGHPFSGGNWGGYVSHGSFTSATASWTEPAVDCNSTDDLFAPWVGLDGDGSSTVEQAGVATDCSSGSPEYQAWVEMYPADPAYYSQSSAPISAGDHVTATITRTGTDTYRLGLGDTTKGWSKTTTRSLSAQHSSAEVIIESPTDSYPDMPGGVTFTGVRFDGTNLGSTSPSALNADDRGVYTYVPGPISGGTGFTISRH